MRSGRISVFSVRSFLTTSQQSLQEQIPRGHVLTQGSDLELQPSDIKGLNINSRSGWDNNAASFLPQEGKNSLKLDNLGSASGKSSCRRWAKRQVKAIYQR